MGKQQIRQLMLMEMEVSLWVRNNKYVYQLLSLEFRKKGNN